MRMQVIYRSTANISFNAVIHCLSREGHVSEARGKLKEEAID